jgi:DNA-binding HxlR family transcriptional regulator
VSTVDTKEAVADVEVRTVLVAKAMELLDERWTLLVVRELLRSIRVLRVSIPWFAIHRIRV